MHKHILINVCMYVCIYVYIERGREREIPKKASNMDFQLASQNVGNCESNLRLISSKFL